MKYEEPVMETIEFSKIDIVRTSPMDGSGDGDDEIEMFG